VQYDNKKEDGQKAGFRHLGW